MFSSHLYWPLRWQNWSDKNKYQLRIEKEIDDRHKQQHEEYVFLNALESRREAHHQSSVQSSPVSPSEPEVSSLAVPSIVSPRVPESTDSGFRPRASINAPA